MTVQAFQPRKIDPPHFVAETFEELADKVGEYIGGEQCDYCGNHSYRITAVGHGSPRPIRGYSAICATDPDEDEEQRHPEPCGKGWPIFSASEDDVCF